MNSFPPSQIKVYQIFQKISNFHTIWFAEILILRNFYDIIEIEKEVRKMLIFLLIMIIVASGFSGSVITTILRVIFDSI